MCFCGLKCTEPNHSRCIWAVIFACGSGWFVFMEIASKLCHHCNAFDFEHEFETLLWQRNDNNIKFVWFSVGLGYPLLHSLLKSFHNLQILRFPSFSLTHLVFIILVSCGALLAAAKLMKNMHLLVELWCRTENSIWKIEKSCSQRSLLLASRNNILIRSLIYTDLHAISFKSSRRRRILVTPFSKSIRK